MLDWTVPLQTQNRFPVKVIHEYYNGVQDMVVVSINRGPMNSLPGARDHEIIKIYDKQWGMDQTNGARSSMDKKSQWDLCPVPPPDKVGYLRVWDSPDPLRLTFDSAASEQEILGTKALGQIKVTVDGATGKIKSVKIL